MCVWGWGAYVGKVREELMIRAAWGGVDMQVFLVGGTHIMGNSASQEEEVELDEEANGKLPWVLTEVTE